MNKSNRTKKTVPTRLEASCRGRWKGRHRLSFSGGGSSSQYVPWLVDLPSELASYGVVELAMNGASV